MKLRLVSYWFSLLLVGNSVFANIPGGGTGTGSNVTLTDNGTTVTIANGIVSIIFTKSSATISTINYTFNNGGGSQTLNLVSGNPNTGRLYWENSNNEGGIFTYSLVVDPAGNGGNYAEIALVSTSVANDELEIHYSMLRGSTGFYVTAIWSHRGTDAAFSMGECRDNIYAGSIFNWMSVDAARNRLMEVSGGTAIGVNGAPVEVSLWINGIYAGQYEDKYKYSADFGDQRVWGWGSVGTGGKNIGLWNIQASVEYKQNGPMKRDLMEHIGTTILNMHNSGHYGGGANDANWAAGEVWTKVYGPYLIYCNNVTNTLTTNAAAQNLYSDALAQAAAEQGIDTNGQPTGAMGAWPYYWFTNANYTPASGRGAVSGQFAISDSGNPNASAAGLWVGLIQQPSTTTSTYDFQAWMKPYQFWVKSDSNGNFTIPNVIATNNYTLYAFGPGAAGTFQSQAQTGGSSPNTKDIPASPFSVTVTAGATNNLGTVTWTPTRVGATVFEIGYPSRSGQGKFRYGFDYWVSEIYTNPAYPSPIWGRFLEFPFDFPSGPNYVVGQSRWTTDWNYVQPCVVSSSGLYNDSSSTITFNLPSAPSGSASFYIALCSDYQGAVEIAVNGSQIAGANGYNPNYSGSGDECDTTIREGINADYSDNRITVPISDLHSGQNTITVDMRQTGKVSGNGYFADHAMYDYMRLELTGYVPPAPASVAAYAGNNCNLISWPATPGATSYNLFSTTTSGSGYSLIASGVTGPVCGSGTNNATYVDTNAVNGTTYYYVVQSANPTGSSANSAQSPGATPSAALSTTAPPPPTGLNVTSVGHQSVALSWSASTGASLYSVWRSVMVNNGGGASNILGTIILNNTNTSTSYTDTSGTDGSIYGYSVTATGAGGTSSNSASVVGVPLPPAPATPPGSLTADYVQGTNGSLNWTAVSGAVGYVIHRAGSLSGPYTLLQSVTETTYTDFNLNTNASYYYQVTAVNAGGISANATASITPAPAAPASLAAIAGNAQVTLVWPASSGATSYILKSGTTSSNETTTVISGYTGLSYTNTGLANGTTYYFVVEASDNGGTSANSPEASSTPTSSPPPSLLWNGAASTAWDTATTNWLNGASGAKYSDPANVSFGNSAVNTNIAIVGAVYPTSVTFSNSGINYSVSSGGGGSGSGIFGPTSLVKSGTGGLTLSNANPFTFGTAISGGVISLAGANGSTAFIGALGSGAVSVNSGGELQLAPPGGTAGRTASFFTNSFNFNGGLIYANDGDEFFTGPAAVSAATTLLRQWNNKTADQAKGLILDGVLSGSAPLNLYGTGGSAAEGARVWFGNGLSTYSGTITVNASANLSGFTAPAGGFSLGIGDNNALRFATVNLLGTQPAGATDTTETYGVQFLNGIWTPVLGALEGNGNIDLNAFGSVPVSLTVGSNNASTTFSGILSSVNDAGSLVKTGSGTMTLSGANTYAGGTTVNGGVLMVNNTTGSGTGSGPVSVSSGATLGGVGTISGSVALVYGATVAPGNPVGALTLGSPLFLPPGSTTLMQVSHSPFTNSSAIISGTIAEAGALVVSNFSGAPFAAGDRFPLFSATSYSGAFDSYTLPSLPAGLAWNTSRLNVDGTLWVVSTVPPSFAGPSFSLNGLAISGSGGTPNWYYCLLTATNPALPRAQWTRVVTNQFDAFGNFTFTNPVNPDVSPSFLMLQQQ